MALENPEIELNPVPEEYRLLYNSIMQDNRLKKKMDRNMRITEKFNYVNYYIPEIKKGGKDVLDIATGPGEFLEVARYYNCNVTGTDISESDLNKAKDIKYISEEYLERYKQYLQISKINVIRQKLNIIYADMHECIMHNNNVLDKKKFDVINCQLAMHLILHKNFNFENVFKENADGSWIINNSLAYSLDKTIHFFHKHLRNGGVVVIEADKAVNLNEYSDMIVSSALKRGFKVELNINSNIHRFKKMGIIDKMIEILRKIYLFFKKRFPF